MRYESIKRYSHNLAINPQLRIVSEVLAKPSDVKTSTLLELLTFLAMEPLLPRFFPWQFPWLSHGHPLKKLMPGRTIGKCASCGWQQCVESRPTSQNLGSTNAGFLAHGFFPHVWPYLIFFIVGLLFQA